MAETKNADKVAYIPVSKIRENQVALRPVDRESEDYQGIAASVKMRGILIPILVREFEDPENKGQILYGLIDGLQRFNAALDAGLDVIPAQITDKDQAEIEEIQIVANAKRIETKPVQYANQIDRLLQRNPTLTVNELSGRLSVSPGWIYKMLGMVKKLHPDLKPKVDSAEIKLANAIELSKLPTEEQTQWADKAQTMDSGEFTANVASRIKAIKEARKKGKAEGPVVFEPVAHARKWAEVKAEYTKPAFRDSILTRNKATTAADGWTLALAWVATMDPDSQAQQKLDHQAREEKNKADADKRKLERETAKEAEAKKTREELQAKIDAANGKAPAPVAAAV